MNQQQTDQPSDRILEIAARPIPIDTSFTPLDMLLELLTEAARQQDENDGK